VFVMCHPQDSSCFFLSLFIFVYIIYTIYIIYYILQSIEPFWHVYRQHFASDLPMRLMEKMVIGELAEEDQEMVDQKMEVLTETALDPYALEPTTTRHEALMVHSEQPMNAEVPEHLLTKNFLTSPNLFYIRHHHPVPYLTAEETNNFELEIDLGAYGKKKISIQDLKKMPKVEVTATLQCAGNRRGGYNDFARTSGTSWGQGAISNAKWGGVRLRDLIKHAGIQDEVDAQENGEMEHVRFHSMDGMMASIGIEKAMNPYGDVILCYEMNGEPLPRDHGYPLRVIVPELSQEEAEGPWQRGLNYKVLPPGVMDANTVDLSKIPSMTELSVQSGITSVVPETSVTAPKPGETILVKASGWAYSGGGRNIVRVDVTGDGATSWKAATLQNGSDQRQGRAWAWTFWECQVPAVVEEDGSVQVYSKGVDLAFNTQPDSAKHNWNMRGLTNNSWYSKKVSAVL
jgi:sulfite oxidase